MASTSEGASEAAGSQVPASSNGNSASTIVTVVWEAAGSSD